MRLRGRIRDKPAVATRFIARVVSCAFPRGEQCTERRTRRRILNHSAATAARFEFFRKREAIYQPVENVRLEFRARRACGPQHSLHIESGRKQFSENGGV